MGFSKYPNQIDDSTTLPPSTDLITPVKAEVVNRLRDAVLAVEQELGTSPSSTFGTVAARLDAIVAGLGELGDTTSGDVSELEDLIETLVAAVQNQLNVHIADTSNPHNVTVDQIGAVAAISSTNNAVARFNGVSGQLKNGPSGPFATDAGRLGIGTSSPSTELEVAGTTTTTDANITSHIRFAERASDPTNIANHSFLYAKNDGGLSELFYQNDSGFVTQITRDGSINGYLNVRDFGAVSDVLGGGDPIQDAIDMMINNVDKYRGIYIPPGTYSITRPLFILKPNSFVRVEMVSTGRDSINSSGYGSCTIRLDGDGYQDWPVMILQGGRLCYFEGIVFYNTGNTAPFDNFASQGIAAHFVLPDRDDWIEAGCRSNSRSPNCCVAIDPFVDGYPGSDIANAYPGLEDYYGGPLLPVPRGNSHAIFKHCSFYGGFVGVASSPPGNVGVSDILHNNENNYFEDCTWVYNTYGYASGQNQERSNTLIRCTFVAGWTGISTEVVGPGGNPGNPPYIFGLHFGLMKYMFDVNAGQRFDASNIYFESTLSFGKIGVGAPSTSSGATLSGITGSFFTASSIGVPAAELLPDVPFHLHTFGMVKIENAILNSNDATSNFFRFWNQTGILTINNFTNGIVSEYDGDHVQIGFDNFFSVRGGPWSTGNTGIGAVYHDDPISEVEFSTLSGNPAITVSAVSGDASTGTALVSNTGGLEVGDLLKISLDSPTGYVPAVITPGEAAYAYFGPIGVISAINRDVSITITDLPYEFSFGSSYRFTRSRWINWYPSITTMTSSFQFFFDPIFEVTESNGSEAEDSDVVSTWSSQGVTISLENSGRQLTQQDATADYPIYDSDVTAINHQPALLFDATDGYHLTLDGTKFLTNFLHSGGGGTIIIGFIYNDNVDGYATLFTTLNESSSNRGLEARVDGYGGVEVLCGRGTPGYVFEEYIPGVLEDGYFHVLTIKHGTSSSPQFDIRIDGVSVASGSYSNAASSSDSTEFFTLGAQSDGSYGFNSHIYAICASNIYVGDSLIAKCEDRLFNRVAW